MRDLRRSPLFCIALLSLAVLSARTTRAANVQHSFPAAPVCARKVAAAQPDPDKKPALAAKKIVRPGRRAQVRNLFGGPFGLAGAHALNILSTHSARHLTLARRAVYALPQHSPLVLRI